jgi:hypothetical protein
LLKSQLGYINFLKILATHNFSLGLYLVTISLVLLYLKIQSSMIVPNILKFAIIIYTNKLRLNYCLWFTFLLSPCLHSKHLDQGSP